MNLSTKVKLELDRLREDRARLIADPLDSSLDADAMQKAATERRDQLSSFNTQIDDAMGRYSTALADEDQKRSAGTTVQTPVADTSRPEVDKLIRLRNRTTLGAYLGFAQNPGTTLSGAEAEFTQEFTPSSRGVRGGPMVPWEFFLPSKDFNELAEKRSLTDLTAGADTNMVTPTADENRAEVLRRLFQGSTLDYLTVDFRSVPDGAYVTPSFSTGADPDSAKATVAKASKIGVSDTAITAVTLKPERFGAMYEFSVEDETLLGGLAALHQDDLMRAMQDALDRKGLGIITGATAAHGKTLSAESGFADYIAIGNDKIDGIFSQSYNHSKVLMPAKVYTHALGQRSSLIESNAVQLLARDGIEVRGTQKLTVPTSGGSANIGVVYVIKPNGERPIMAVWRGVELVVDRVTQADAGVTRVTAYMLVNGMLPRQGVIVQDAFQIA